VSTPDPAERLRQLVVQLREDVTVLQTQVRERDREIERLRVWSKRLTDGLRQVSGLAACVLIEPMPAEPQSLAGKGPLITFWEDGSVTVDDRPAGEFPFKPEPQ